MISSAFMDVAKKDRFQYMEASIKSFTVDQATKITFNARRGIVGNRAR